MPIPAGYTQLTTGFWRKDSDLSGPYAWTGAAFYLISTGVAGSGVPADYTQHPSGFWFKTADGSGPYSYDGTDFWLAGNGGPSGAITVATVNVSSAINMSNGSTFNLYNTPDQTTNYERLRGYWSANVASILMQHGGSASPRSILIGVSGSGATHQYASAQISSTGHQFAWVPNGSSGTQAGISVVPNINQSGTAGYTALDINPTETTTGSGTKLLQRWAVGGTAAALMSNNGFLYVNNLSLSGSYGWSASFGGAADVNLFRDAANTLALRNGVNAQLLRTYETFTDASNYSRCLVGVVGTTFVFRSEAAGTGTARNISIGPNGTGAVLIFRSAGTDQAQFDASGNFIAQTDNQIDFGKAGANRFKNSYLSDTSHAAAFRLTVISAVSGLPSAASDTYTRRVVNDSNVGMAGNYGAIVAGGGANIVPVFSDGTNWRIG